MLARVAESLYWMARYIERAEDTARLINAHAQFALDVPQPAVRAWEPLAAMAGGAALFRERYRTADARSVMRFLIADPAHPNAVVNCLARARENARSVRDTLPREAWEQVNDLYLYACTGARRRQYDYLQFIVASAQRFTGMLAGTMNHDAGYQFIRMGRNLERGDMTTRIVEVGVAQSLFKRTGELDRFETIQWMAVLKSLSAYQMYRQYARGARAATAVLPFLLQNEGFPRAVAHCIGEAQRAAMQLPQPGSVLAELACVKDFLARVSWHSVTTHADVSALLSDLQAAIARTHDAIDRGYFHPAQNDAPLAAHSPPAPLAAALARDGDA